MKITMGNAAPAGTVTFDGGPSEQDDNEHRARMIEAASANVETFTDNRGVPAYEPNRAELAQETPEDRIRASLQLTAGGSQEYAEIMAMAAKHGEPELIASYNAAIDQATKAETENERRIGMSKAEAIVNALKESRQTLIDRANDDGSPDVQIIR